MIISNIFLRIVRKGNVRQPLRSVATIVKGHRAALHTKVSYFRRSKSNFHLSAFRNDRASRFDFRASVPIDLSVLGSAACVGHLRRMGSSLDSKSLKLIVEAVELARAKESVVFVSSTTSPKSSRRNPQSVDLSSRDRDPEERNNDGFHDSSITVIS